METRGEQMLALRKQRLASSLPCFRGGFRPFFTGGAAWSLVALILWICTLNGAITLPTQFDPLAWHRHEMLFGFVGAVIAGFLLTAIPNWTGRLPIAGAPLASLFGLWLAARLANLFSSAVGPLPAALIDVGFFLVLAALATREVLASQNRNLPIVAMVLLFGIANAVDHAASVGWLADDMAGVRAGIALVILMISLIGGRIVPSFTRNWLVKQGATTGLPTQPSWLDVFVIVATALALASWVAALPNDRVSGLLLVSTAILQGMRLARWSGLRTVRDPLVAILHLGYAWVPVGLLLLGLSMVRADVPRTIAIHALTAGAMATMILAVMTRATLGHTGRELRADGSTMTIYGLVTVGAALRVVAPWLSVDYLLLIQLSGMLWGGSFLLFLAVYGPMLLGPRPDGRA